MAKDTWEVKIVAELNHDLFTFTKALKDGWQMNGRWKEGGLMIELFKTARASMKFDRMIPSGPSWLMGIKVHRVYDEAHAAMEAGKSISATKLHQITGHTGEDLLKPTANYMKLKLLSRLPPCDACAKAPVHLKEMYKVIRHVLSTKGYGLKFELRKDIIKWALKALSDSDFASDKETRISVFGYIIYFCGIPIAWQSKGVKSVVLSTTEAEYMALSEVVKELKFIVQLLKTMNIEVELPITVHVDNVGAIWLSNDRTTSDRTKHIDIRTSSVKEYQEDGKIIIKFVKSEENEADIFTKNTTNVIFSNHQKKLVWDKTNVDNEVNQELNQSKNEQEGC